MIEVASLIYGDEHYEVAPFYLYMFTIRISSMM